MLHFMNLKTNALPFMIGYDIYLIAIGCTLSGSSTVHIYTQTLHRIQRTGHRSQQKKIGNCGPCSFFASYTLEIALQLGKMHGKPLVRVAAGTSQADTVQYKKTEQYNTQKKNNNTDYLVHIR
jgi:hypothetical protein